MNVVPQTSAAKRCTQLRHELILAVLRFHSPATPGEVTELLKAQIHAGTVEWPPAPWLHAKDRPYDTGTRQMLESMRNKGWVEQVEVQAGGGHRLTAYVPARGKMRNRADEALALKAQGLNGKQIAGRMGVSSSLAYGLLNDPFGDKERERKKRYCGGCGAKKKAGAEACQSCVKKRAEELLPPEAFAAIAQNYERETGCPVVFGVTPGMRRVIRIGTGRGIVEHEVRTDQGWEEAVEELLAC